MILFAFSVIGWRLYSVQIRQGAEYARKSRENFIQLRRLEHDRGEMVDREGRLLVSNRPSLDVYVTAAFLPATERMITRLGTEAGLGKGESKIVSQAFLRTAQESGPPILLARNLSEKQAAALRKVQDELDIPLDAVPIIETTGDDGDRTIAAYLDPLSFPSPEKIFRRLAAIMDLLPGELTAMQRNIREARGLDRYVDYMIRHDVAPHVVERITQEIELGELPGVSLRAAKARHYLHGKLAAHLLGYVNELSPKELEDRKELGYKLGDQIGRRGLEETFEEDLRGVDGHEPVVTDSKGRPQQSTFAKDLRSAFGEVELPRAGNRVVLSLDLDIQKAAEAAFNERAGAVVVMEVATGRLLAVTSTPSFDPNLVSGYFDPREKARLDEMRLLRPWRFRAIQDHFAPGSTFKPITLITALSRHEATEYETVHCNGAFRLGNVRFRCWKDTGHGTINASASLMRSCDVWYYTMGNRMGLDPIAEMALSFGFGAPTGIPVGGESHGIIPTEAWYRARDGYTRGAAVNASIGQGAVAVTPIQLVTAYAALANSGTVFEPQVALRVEAYDGSAVREFKPKPRRKLEVPDEVWRVAHDGLKRVVNDPNGTAYARRLKDLEVSGKTGTAQVAKLGEKRLKPDQIPWPLRDHAWFAAYAPADSPEIAVVVMVEHGGGGSKVAAPIAMQTIHAWWSKQEKRASLMTHPLEIAVAGDVEGPWPAGD